MFAFLRIVRFARDYIKRFPGRGAFLLAFLCRKLNIWWRFWLGESGPPKPARRPFSETQARSYSVSSGSAVVRDHVVAASSVPASANQSSPLDRIEEQPGAATQAIDVHLPGLSNISVDHPHADNPSSHPFGGRSLFNRSSVSLSDISVQSRAARASDRLAIITKSPDLLCAPRGQPSRLLRGTYRQFGHASEPAWSRESTRPSTPTIRSRTPTYPRRLEIITGRLPSTHEDGEVGPVVQPPASSSYTHEPLSPPTMSEIRRSQSSTSFVVDVQNSSMDSPPTSTLANLPQISDEPFNIDSPTVHSSADSPAVEQPDETGSSTSSSHPTVNYFIPEGRFVQLINSDQIPRYEKKATM